MIVALLLSAFSVCQPAGVDGDLADVTRAWFIARWMREARAPEASDDLVLAAQRRALGAWGRAARDPRLLREAARLTAVFRRSIDYPTIVGDGEVRPWAGETGVSVRVPLGYTPTLAWPTLVAAFDPDTETAPAVAQRTLGLVDPDWIVVLVDAGRLASFVRAPVVPRLTTWGAASLAGSALVWAVGPSALGLALWRFAFESAVGAEAEVDERDLPRGLFALLGGVQRRLHIDRERLVLVCSGRAGQIGVRAAATAPDRFAGLVLWAPEAAPSGPLDNLAMVSTLVVADAGGGAAATAHAALTKVTGAVLALRAWPEEEAEISAWLRGQRRDLFRRRLAFVMEEDAIVDGFWLRIDAADFSSARGERRAGIEATTDRASNTITVTARHVDEFTLLLSDAMVDLDRPVVIEINGARANLRRVRSAEFLLESVFQRFDPGYVFTTAITLAVPRRG